MHLPISTAIDTTFRQHSRKAWIAPVVVTTVLGMTACAETDDPPVNIVKADQCPAHSAAFKRACDVIKQQDYARGDRIVRASLVHLKTLTPLISTDVYASYVQGQVLESLLTRDPDTLAWQGLIAKSWQVATDGLGVGGASPTSPLTITFQLRDDVKFSDGKPLTAADVVFTVNFIMTAAISAPRHRAYMERVKEVKANGPHTVVFVYKEPYFKALEIAGGMEILPKHIYEPYLQKTAEFNESKGILLGSGPYRLRDPHKGWTPGDDGGNVVLVRNENYWGDVQPSYDRMVWKVVQDENARLVKYRNGEIDDLEPRPLEYLPLQSTPEIKDKSNGFAYMPPAAPYRYISWNQRRSGQPTRFADKLVRQAMSYLTDVNRIIKEVYVGHAEPAVGPFGNHQKQHDTKLLPYGYDQTKAYGLLKAAGYADRNGDGVLEDQSGRAFEFALNYRTGNEDFERMLLLLRDLYAQAGVKMHLRPLEWTVLLQKLKERDFDAIMIGWTGSIESDLYQTFHSSQTADDGDNYTYYRNEYLDKVIELARATVDESLRMPIWQQAERIIYEDQPYTFLLYEKELLFIDKRFHNVRLSEQSGLNWGGLPVETYVPKVLQRYQP